MASTTEDRLTYHDLPQRGLLWDPCAMEEIVPTVFWTQLDAIVETSELIIDRPKGSRHPRVSSKRAQ